MKSCQFINLFIITIKNINKVIKYKLYNYINIIFL